MISSPELPARVLRGSAAAEAQSAPLGNVLQAHVPVDAATVVIRAAARAEGYAVGWAEGRRAADEAAALEASVAAGERAEAAARAAHDVAAALQALHAAASALEARAVVPAAELADAVTAGAFELAQALLGRELSLAVDPGLDAIRRALVMLPEGRPVTVRLNPDDASVTRESLASASLGREIHVVPDPAVEPGGAVVDCDATRVDAQLGLALQRVREVLGL
jgi:flagellar assembly protein FliH